MKRFSYFNATTLDEAISALGSGDGIVIAGGTDIINIIKARSQPKSPKRVINIKNISQLNGIVEENDYVKIGALTKLYKIAEDKIIRENFPLLYRAALTIASPQIRNMGTIGGNLCQETRCWYYRYPENVFNCLRKGGKNCPAITAENHFHSVFGAAKVSDTPCQSACPGGVNIPLYLSKIREAKIKEAARIVLESNPIPAITGRVCPHFCQQECNRKDLDESVSIRSIERYIGDYILKNTDTLMEVPNKGVKTRVAIIGSGPAGLSAAYFLRKLGYKVTIFERGEKAGGMLYHGIPAYRLPREIVERVVCAIKKMGVEFRLRTYVGKDISLDSLRKDFDSVFISTGAWIPRSIGIEGEELTVSGLSFLTGNLPPNYSVKGKRVLVIGGGNVAVDVGITAKRLGAKEVTLVCLESRKEMPAFEWEIKQALEEGIMLMPSWGPKKVLINGNAKSVELVRCVSVFDEVGNFCPCLDESVKEFKEVDEVIMAVGQKADLSFIGNSLPLETEKGLIKTDPQTQRTNVYDIFAGGDVTTGPASVIQAVAAGRKAAFAIDSLLGRLKPTSKDLAESSSHPFLSFNPNYLRRTHSLGIRVKSISERTLNEEDIFGFIWEEAFEEANRCLNCGCVSVNPSDLAPALIALDAKIKTTKRIVPAEKFFKVRVMKSTTLEDDEIVTYIEIPKPKKETKQAFLKFRIRKTIDFPIVCVATVLNFNAGKISEGRIAINGVAPIPLRVTAAEEILIGKEINEENAEAAAEASTIGTIALSKNKYIVQIIKTLVKRAILSCK